MLRQPKVIRNDLSIYDQVDPWWDEASPILDPLRRLAQPRMAYLSRFVDPVGQRLLDVGCGGGSQVVEFLLREALVAVCRARDPSPFVPFSGDAHLA